VNELLFKFFNTQFRQACDDRVPSISEYLISDYRFSPSQHNYALYRTFYLILTLDILFIDEVML